MSLNDRLLEYAKSISGPAYIKELFPDPFIRQYTKCKTAETFFLEAGVVNQASFEAWLASGADSYCKANTTFDSWDEMFSTAARQLASARQRRLRKKKPISQRPVGEDPFFLITIEISYHVG